MRSFFMNYFSLYHWNGIKWEAISNPVFPPGFSSLLDERLDEAYVTFYNAKKDEYKPTDAFALTFYENGKAVKNLGLCVAMDRVTNLPLGSNRYKHELSLIEPTKLAEGIMCQTLTFTNDLGKVYTANAKAVAPTVEGYDTDDLYGLTYEGIYTSPVDSSVVLISASTFFANLRFVESGTTIGSRISTLKVNGIEYENYTISKSGTYIVEYYCDLVGVHGDGSSSFKKVTVTYTIIFVQNRLPLLPYTITDVVCRCLELAEPLYTSETPRIIFDGVEYSDSLTEARSYVPGSQAEKYSTVFAPELAITQANLREQLKRIGGYIHAEPRIKFDYENTDGSPGKEPTLVLYFDPLIQSKAADLSKGFLTYRGLSRSINEYNTEVRSNAANLVNTLDYAQGVVTEPYANGYKSLRADLNQRMSEENAYAPTGKGVYAITRVMCGITDGGTWERNPVDITAYVLEKAAYDLLSDYDKEFPNARSLALYYTQGQEGIHGFFTRSSTVGAFQPWQNYAIVRILAREMGVSEGTIQGLIGDAANGIGKIVTQISYIPIYENMISHSKQKYVLNETPFSQNYLQSDNLVETRYFGENIKGVAARLGNLEEERTYSFRSIKDLPNVGETVDGFVIAGIEAQFMPTYTKASLYLAKKFNRISEFVGINSNKRVYEVSEREAYERHILIKNKIVFSTNIQASASTIITPNNVMACFSTPNAVKKIHSVGVLSYNANVTDVGDKLILPVVSSAFGNAMTFTFSMKDNYSAGEKIAYESEGGVSGYWASDVPYADYYGRISTMVFYLYGDNYNSALQFANSLPSANSINTNGTINLTDGLFIDKDSRERLSFTVELEAQTTDDDIIIGSGFASGNPLVNSDSVKPLLYLYDTPFTEFDTNIADNKGTLVYRFDPDRGYTYEDGILSFETATNFQTSNKDAYWVIAYPRYKDSVTEYENKYGNKVTSSIFKGGEILLASTKPVEAGKLIHDTIHVTIQK